MSASSPLQEWAVAFLENVPTLPTPSLWLEQERIAGRLFSFLPELGKCYGVEQNQYHKYDVYYHLLHSCDAAPARLELRLAALFHDIGKPREKKIIQGKTVFYNHELTSTSLAYEILTRLGLPESPKKKITLLIRHHMFHYRENWSDSAIRRILKKVGSENLEDLFLLRIADRVGNGTRQGESEKVKELKKHIQRVIQAENSFKIKDLDIDGRDILALGVAPGPEIGKVLRYLFEQAQGENISNERAPLHECARNFIEKENLNREE
ncbi:MAG: hypothetical protein CVV50_01270 [Spirochaetae bacterium HGW-Spirochaetae-6]|nr:MAG: hypothetical protein CVV50_01270 [Spirochaetae bacterium HGW-Spirochaetae-6]